MNIVDWIRKKRDGLELEDREIASLIEGYVHGEVEDYQISAWLMAVYLRGMSDRETLALTRAMWASGTTLRKPESNTQPELWVDKHSTGGVGDKTSLLLVPLVTSVIQRLRDLGEIDHGVAIPMISGRGLGFTGGTLDKLDSIPGFRTRFSISEAMAQLARNHFFIIAQTDELAPADRGIYALRDVTATVDSRPLVVSSILSKKFAAGLDALVLDIKVGSGAFTTSIESGRELAHHLVHVCHLQSIDCIAVLTRMDEPLGWAVGHRCEVEECFDFFANRDRDRGLYEVTLELAAWMVSIATKGALDQTNAKACCIEELRSGRPGQYFEQFLNSQGARLEDFWAARAEVKRRGRTSVPAPRSGWISQIDARGLSAVLHLMGGGRERAGDQIDFDSGIWMQKKTGDRVVEGETLAFLEGIPEHCDASLISRIEKCFDLVDEPIPSGEWVLEIIRPSAEQSGEVNVPSTR